MRGLFAQELHQVSTRIAAALANRDTAALSSELHKLQASCGFVGAARLGTAARVLQHTLNAANAMPQFEGALQDTRASLSG